MAGDRFSMAWRAALVSALEIGLAALGFTGYGLGFRDTELRRQLRVMVPGNSVCRILANTLSHRREHGCVSGDASNLKPKCFTSTEAYHTGEGADTSAGLRQCTAPRASWYPV